MQAKLELRKAMLARRDSLVSEVRTRLSDRIAKSIVEMPFSAGRRGARLHEYWQRV